MIIFKVSIKDFLQSKLNFFQEFARIFLLFILVVISYWGMITGCAISNGGDADSYNQTLHDAIIQSSEGVFPTYVGQTVFKFFGNSSIRGPFYCIFGQVLNFITFGKLSSIQLQHLIILLGALVGTFFMYFSLIKLAPKLRWIAMVLSFLYITCPGVLGLIYNLKSPQEFLPVMFLPIVGYGLITSCLKKDVLCFLLTASGLSLIFMACLSYSCLLDFSRLVADD
jgi:hypothetical protein